MIRFLAITLCMSFAAACAGSRPTGRLDPAEFRQRALTTAGASVALTTDDEPVGTLEIASSGAFHTVLGAQRMPVIHVRLTVRNEDIAPMHVGADDLALWGIGAGALRPAGLFTADGDTLIPPDSVRVIDVVFELPSGVEIGDVRAFTVGWSVELTGGPVRGQAPFETVAGVANAFRPVVNQ